MQRQLRFAVAVAGAVVALAASGTALAANASPTVADPQAAASMVRTTSLESSVLRAINVVRRAHKLAPLRASAQLADAAEAHSLDMGRYGYFTHEDRDGSEFWKRVEALYPSAGASMWQVGENMLWSAADEFDADAAVEMWMNSPPHRENLLNPRWREIGLGGVKALAAPGVYAGYDVTILTADFGIRR